MKTSTLLLFVLALFNYSCLSMQDDELQAKKSEKKVEKAIKKKREGKSDEGDEKFAKARKKESQIDARPIPTPPKDRVKLIPSSVIQ